jgi:hypothetical protein
MVTAAIGTMAIPTEAAFLICLVWSILANSGSLWLRPPVPDFGKLNRRQCVEAGRQRRQVQVALVVSKAVICTSSKLYETSGHHASGETGWFLPFELRVLDRRARCTTL